jgi:hypothetical protein
MTGGENKPHYVWAPYPFTPPPYQFIMGRERAPKGDYQGGHEPVKDIDPPPP